MDNEEFIDYDPLAPMEEETFEEDNSLVPSGSSHEANLADSDLLSDSVLQKLGSFIVDAVQDDIASRSEWESSLKNGVKLLGNKIEPKEWPFKNASGVWDTIMMQAVLSFQATAYPELLPADGPVKSDIMGDETPETLEIAQRQEEWGNYFLTQIATEYYPEFDQMLFYIPLFGCAFKKVFQDPVKNRPVLPFIKPQEFVVNYGTTSLESCSRMTQIIKLTEKEIRDYQNSGFYRNTSLQAQDEGDSPSTLQNSIDSMDGIKPGSEEYNKEYTLYECHIDIDLNDFLGLGDNQIEFKDKTFLPYIVTVDVESCKILSIYKNWDEHEEDLVKLQYFVDYQFIRGLGFYGYGYSHILGNQAHTATAILRQLIDAGMLANFPGGLRVKGMQLENDTLRIGPGQFPEIETGGLPIQQSIMNLPYKEPSNTLFTLLEKVEQNASQLAGAANLQTADFNINAPVGTTLALLEQTQKLQSTIMRRLHQSMRQEFRLLYNLFKKNLTEEKFEFNGKGAKNFISRKDFIDNIQIIPVSDPNSQSSTHRLIKYESILKLAAQFPQIHDMRQIYEMIYRELKIGNIDKILPQQKEIPPLDPITENMYLMTNKPVQAFIWQDQDAYIAVNSLLLNNPNPQIVATTQAHIQQREAFRFMLSMQQMMGMQLPPQPEQLPPEAQNEIAMAAAQAVQQMQQQQQQQNPAPLDPALVMLEDVKVKAMGIERKAESEDLRTEARFEIDQQKVDLDREKMLLEKGFINGI